MKLALGTVQFGVPYGISNTVGQTPLKEAARILQLATERNVDLLDTASGYGTSEEVLGNLLLNESTFKDKFEIITKFKADSVEAAQTQFNESLKKLQTHSIYGLLAHSSQSLIASKSKEFWDWLHGLQKDGVVKKIGASIYDEAEIRSLLNSGFDFNLIQIPFNILDQRLMRSGILDELKSRGVEIHVRSAFLQGLLLMPLQELPVKLAALESTLKRLQAYALKNQFTVMQLALGFLVRQSVVDRIVIGVNTAEQFSQVLESYDFATSAEFSGVEWGVFAFNGDPKFLDPLQWLSL